MTFWDAPSGAELSSLKMDDSYYVSSLACSSDSRRLAVVLLSRDKPGQLLLIDLAKRKVMKTLTLDGDYLPNGGRINVSLPAFSPDGRWIAIASQAVPANQSPTFAKAEMLGQPHIHLIDAETGDVREILAAPAGVVNSLCFSPDGKTLANGGDGRVLLWDMTKPPGLPH